MIVSQMRVNSKGEWETCSAKAHGLDADLALVFWSDTDENTVVAAVEALGIHCPRTTLTGFYSYGEIGSDEAGTTCCLHNQTMTVSVLREQG